MFVFNTLTSRAISVGILILGATIGYSIYTKGTTTSNLNVVTPKQAYVGTQNENVPSNLGGLLGATTTNFIPNSLTGIVGQEIFSIFTKTDSTKIDITDDVVDKVSGSFSSAIEDNPLINFKEYTEQDITINRNASVNDRKYFVDRINAIIESYRGRFEDLSQSKQPESGSPETAIFSVLTKSSVVYKNLAIDLAKLSVPSQEEVGFIYLLNSYSLSASGLAESKYYSSDPVRAGAGLKIHQQGSFLEIIAIKELTNSLKVSGIIFRLIPLSS